MSLAPLDLFTPDSPVLADPDAIAKAQLLPPLDVAGFGTRARLDYRSARAQMADWISGRHLEQVEDAIERAYKLTGKRIANPFAATQYEELREIRRRMIRGEDVRGMEPRTREQRFAEFEAQYDELRKQHPELPDPRTFRARAAEELRERVRAAAAARRTSTGLGDIGGFIGGTAAEMLHPLNLMTLPFGAPGALYAPVRAGLLGALVRIAQVGAIESGIAATTQAVIGAEKLERLPALGVPYGMSDYVEEILGAGTAGFVLGGGLRALVAAWRGVRGTPAAARLTPAERLDADTAAQAGERLVQERLALGDPDAAMEARAAVVAGRVEEIPPAPLSPDAVPVFTASGRRIGVQYEAVDVRSLIPSHTDDLRVNEAYPEGLQPRDRTRVASEAQIAEIAGRLEPERLGRSADAAAGAPIIGPDNVVESGSGRVLALRRAYAQHSERAAAYRAWLKAQGVDIEGIEKPVLIARRVTALSEQERLAFAREANASVAMRPGAAEQAAADWAIVDKIIDLYRGGAVTAEANRNFARAFAKALPASERAALVTKAGALSQEGARRLQGALLYAAYGDAPLVAKLMESTAGEIKAIGGALLDQAGAWAKLRAAARQGLIAPDMDRTADLLGAVRLIEKARADGIKPADLLAQGTLFESPEATRLFAAMFHRDADLSRAASRSAISERLAGYIDEAMKTRPETDLFGAPPPAARELLLATDHQRLMAAVVDEAKLARESAAAGAPPAGAIGEARVAEARAALTDSDIAVSLDGVSYVPARRAFDEAEAAVKAAEAVEQCAIGAAI